VGWIYLSIAGLLEIGFATSMKLSSGLTKPLWTVSFILCAIASFGFLNMAIKTLPMSTAYAVWTGIGAVGVVTIGILVFNEPVSLARLFFLGLLIVAMIGLKLVSS
jgi:quaternary ammonium compound-resistance protein SugE